MTVKELKDWLSCYSDDMEVSVAIDSMIRPLTVLETILLVLLPSYFTNE